MNHRLVLYVVALSIVATIAVVTLIQSHTSFLLTFTNIEPLLLATSVCAATIWLLRVLYVHRLAACTNNAYLVYGFISMLVLPALLYELYFTIPSHLTSFKLAVKLIAAGCMLSGLIQLAFARGEESHRRSS